MAKQSNRDSMIHAGNRLMKVNGFSATGVQEIADAAGVPKGSFYNHFRSKEAFAASVIRDHALRMSEALEHDLLRPIQHGESPLESLERLFRSWESQSRASEPPAGCLIGNLCQEIAHQTEELRVAFEESLALVESKLEACLAEAREQNQLPDGTDVKLTAHFIYNAWQGAMLRSKAQTNDEALVAFHQVVFLRVLK